MSEAGGAEARADPVADAELPRAEDDLAGGAADVKVAAVLVLARDAGDGAERLAVAQQHAPAGGPLLILANHHNGLVDPMLVMASSERAVRFLAKAPLFEIPGLGWLLGRLSAVPVHRRQDPGYDKEKNEGVYAAVTEALAAGGADCLACHSW